MPKEVFAETQGEKDLDVWIYGNKYELSDLINEMRLIRTTLSPTDIKRLFPDDPRFKLPLVATPRMIEDFLGAYDETWQENADFSLAPALSSLIGRLREVASEAHIIYNKLGAYFRALMVSNLLRSGWRPQKKEINFEQNEFNRQFESRLKRLVDSTNSDFWRRVSDQRGVLIWTTAQAEVLTFMEDSTTWRRVFQRTQRELSGRK